MDEKLWCVYKHTNKATGKVYVGRCRWPNYKKRWNNGNGYKNAMLFWPEIEKYGWNGFTHEILYSALDLAEANRLERETIRLLKANDPEYGYNICDGGTGFSAHHSQATRDQISASMSKYEKTALHRRHLSESMLGTKHPRAKRVCQLTKEGRLIKVWDYMNEACTALNLQKSNVSACCRGKRPSAGGYKWVYERG